MLGPLVDLQGTSLGHRVLPGIMGKWSQGRLQLASYSYDIELVAGLYEEKKEKLEIR